MPPHPDSTREAQMRLVILDRDGVINQDSEHHIRSPAEWEPLPGSLEAIARLSHAGVKVAIATNQSGVARGFFDIDALNAIHQTLRARLTVFGGRIELIAFCAHGPEQQCHCRKPQIGLLREIGRRTGLSLKGAPVIGDSLRDLEAAGGVGARPMLVRTGKGEQTAAALPSHWQGVCVAEDLSAAVDLLLAG
jgi:D-glycero-D-manno-heptose 1,7-bisphosphate phosphatase